MGSSFLRGIKNFYGYRKEWVGVGSIGAWTKRFVRSPCGVVLTGIG